MSRQVGAALRHRIAWSSAWVALAGLFNGGCALSPHVTEGDTTIDAIAAELDKMSLGLTDRHRETFRSILEDTLAKDGYVCRPTPRQVFFGEAPEGERTITGVMPHYGFFFGPMHYVVRRAETRAEREASAGGGEAGAPRFRVEVTVGVDPPMSREKAELLELPDCALVQELGVGSCRGVAYEDAAGRSACPTSGVFTTPATKAAVRALLARWSREAEALYNRDAELFGLPVRYDFTFAVIGETLSEGAPAPARYDITLPLAPTCGRTPYFSAFRSGWSVPVVAHEIGHVLGLLDEYETFSGIVPAYPKTPFAGAEVSRMGLSMKRGTRVLPLHHYLVLRRFFCPEPAPGGFYQGAGL